MAVVFWAKSYLDDHFKAWACMERYINRSILISPETPFAQVAIKIEKINFTNIISVASMN
jgi:hypothetical protein